MSDWQIYLAGLREMPWLLIIPIAIIWTGISEAVNGKWDGRLSK